MAKPLNTATSAALKQLLTKKKKKADPSVGGITSTYAPFVRYQNVIRSSRKSGKGGVK